jgi:hypothetical protein
VAVRYERIDVQLMTRSCAVLLELLDECVDESIGEELVNLRNELRARLQRKDADPHAPKNQEMTCDDSWLS